MKNEETIAKKIIIEELEDQAHPEPVEDVIYWALKYYSEHKKGTWGSTIANCIVSRIEEEENSHV